MTHCCADMTRHVESECDQHESRYDCPDALIEYRPRTKEYGLIVHDGGTSMISIRFCPFCGSPLSGTAS